MKRAARHRKRNAPPGPCGVLWEMCRSKVPKSKLREEEEEFTHRRVENIEGSVLFPDDGDGSNANGNTIGSISGKKNRDDEQYDASTPPAWMAMQRSLDIATPYLPLSTRGNVQKRYELLRSHLPQNYILLPEILSGSHDLKISDPNLYLCVWVNSIEERNSHHGIWTVELRDETGATIRAWMEPNFVKEELQKAQQAEKTSMNKGVVRVGVVWMLANFSMIAIHNNSNNNSNTGNGMIVGNSNKNGDGGVIERMLVVSGKLIRRVWTPELDRAQNQPNEEEDSPEAQRKYLDWMEKRNALTVFDEDSNLKVDDIDNEPPKKIEDEMEEEGGLDHHDRRRTDDEQKSNHRSHRRIVGGKEHQERMTAMSALTMTADDESVTVNSQHITMANGCDGNLSSPNELNQAGVQSTSPSANPNVNLRDSDRIAIESRSGHINNNNDGEVYDENHREFSVLLHTQESCQVKNKIDTKCDEKKNSSSHHAKELTTEARHHNNMYHDSNQQNGQPLTRRNPTRRNSNKNIHISRDVRDIASCPELSPEEHPGNAFMAKMHEKKKYKKKNEDPNGLSSIQDRVMNRISPKRSRRDRSSAYSSHIRLSQSVWNTPDPMILEMLEEEEDKNRSVEEEEVETVIWVESSPSLFSTQTSKEKRFFPGTSRRSETEISTLGESKGNASHVIKDTIYIRSDKNDDETNGDVSSLLIGRVSLGDNLFEPTNWAGMDVGAFSESDCE